MKENSKIKVLVAEDQELVRKSLEIILGNQDTIELIGAVSNGQEVIRFIRESLPDIIIMDIRMPKMDGVTCTRIIKDQYPQVKIIILTTFDDDEYIFKALRDGASGYLLKGISVDELITAIHKVYKGSAMINEDIASKVVNLFADIAKSKLYIEVNELGKKDINTTEKKIIILVSQGLSNKEIAGELSLSEGTVRNYLSNILEKLNLRDRTQLAIWAIQSSVQL
jgi:two component transcriptional regulator, luxR family